MNDAQPWVLEWETAFLAGSLVVGGKGWNLARLARYGFQVPRGSILVAAAYEQFIEHNRLREQIRAIADRLDSEELLRPEGQQRLADLRRAITEGGMPPELGNALGEALYCNGLIDRPLAVRSSATLEDGQTTSFAGIHDSFLNRLGLPSVLEAIKGCYASLWSERAVAYRRRMGISDYDLAPAVVLLEMVAARSAGVAFSCDPLSGRPDRMTIAANFGLGESVAGGTVEPDQYLLQRDGFNGEPSLIATRIGAKGSYSLPCPQGGTRTAPAQDHAADQQVLDDENILRLGRLMRQVQLCLGQGEQPQDIEWAFDGADFWLLQARPVTALPRFTYPALQDQPDIWSNANFRDAVPMVQTPFNWSVSRLMIEQVLTRQYLAAGYRIEAGMPRFMLYNGRPYFNLAVMQWECLDAFGLPPEQYNQFIGGHQPEIRPTGPASLRKKLRQALHNLRLLREIGRARSHAAGTFHQFIRHVDRLRSRDLTELDSKGLLRLLKESPAPIALSDPILLMLASSGGVFMTLQPLLERYLPGRGRALTVALLAGQEGITSADHGIRLLELAAIVRRDPDARAFFAASPFKPLDWSGLPIRSAFKREFRRFLDDYGHRSVYELDFCNPRWYEDPSWLLETVRGMLDNADPEAVRAKQRETAQRAWQELRSAVPRLLHGLVKKLAAMGGTDAANREMAKSVLVRMVDFYRRFALELGQRLAGQGLIRQQQDIYFCYWNELIELLEGQWDGRGLAERIEDRRRQHLLWQALPAPDLVIDEEPRHAVSAAVTGDRRLTGLGVAAGQASGAARLIRHPAEGGRLVQGEVLVAPSTDPAWTPLFLRAAALVTETGGFISHGAIVAREYGIPAVVNVPGALQRINDGQQLHVDGDQGIVGLD